MTTIGGVLYNQFFVTPPYPTQDFTGLTAIVTGSNTGLGLEAARHLVRLNAERVILAVRSISKGENAKESIEQSTNRKGVVEVWELDLSRYDSVKEFAKRCNRDLKRLDCVIENAGINTPIYTTMEGSESSLTVNVYSTFLLGILLLPLLRKTAVNFNTKTRLTFVVSELHGFVSLPKTSGSNILHTLEADHSPAAMGRRYAMTKLLEVLIIRELATQMGDPEEQGVIVNAVNPGFCVSELVRNQSRWRSLITQFMFFVLARTTEVGSRTEVYGAAGAAATHGQYMSNCVVEP